MAVDFAHYAGREPAFVKHTFLDKYLPALTGRIVSKYDAFVYIDGFAGPWKSVAGETFADTSFGIALQHMTAQKIFYAQRGRNVKMKAILVEKDARTFAALEQAVKAYPKIECLCLKGELEDQVSRILSEIADDAFSFSLIDPKGFPDVERIMPLIQRPHSEALVNFMFDFANRFAGTKLIPTLERWLSSLGDSTWQAEIEHVYGADRELRLEELAVEKLRKQAGYAYAPVISVDKPIYDRTLYKLILLTRHSAGLDVFRVSERGALEAQATSRSHAKAGAREAKFGMADIFGGKADIPSDRCSKRMHDGEEQAKTRLLSSLKRAGSAGATWRDVWPAILETTVITRSALGRLTNDLRKSKVIDAPDWPSERQSIPKDDQVLRLA
jgi:three-Cys-motif partner protein